MTKKTTGRVKIPKLVVAHTAAGQLLGYSTQQIRLTMLLQEARAGSACSIEVLDDVAEERDDGTTKLVQSKSSLGQNPISNHALPLWKTLFNWVDLVEKGQLQLATTTLELYLTKKFDGAIAELWSSAVSESEAQDALAFTREIMWGREPQRELKTKLSKQLAPFVNGVLSKPDSLLLPMIQRVRLFCDSGSPHATLMSLFANDPISKSRVADFADKMCGWVKRQTDELIAQGKPAVVLRDDYLHEYTMLVRKYDRDSILSAYSRQPSKEQALARIPDPFVRQLGLIDISYEEQLRAIGDFLRAGEERTHWARVGDVQRESFDELDDDLQRVWVNHQRMTEISHKSRSDLERGQLLYGACSLYTTTVQQMEPPSFFIPGCFHRLANTLKIGWHPDYKNLLNGDTSKP